MKETTEVAGQNNMNTKCYNSQDERAIEENESFEDDLDRVHNWFVRELSDIQKLVCLRELLSLMSPSQQQFLFNSMKLRADKDNITEPESAFAIDSVSLSRLQNLDLTPGESLFEGLSISKSKQLPAIKTDNAALSDLSHNKNAKIHAPPGFLSPTASEFRPSEPSCHADVYLVDLGQWLRLLRLHKYYDTLSPVYESDRIALLKMTEKDLEAVGVAALGARRKFLRLFERICSEKQI